MAAVGEPPTLITFVATVEPQALVKVYLIVSIPALTPVTIPPLVTVAIDGNTLLHTPPLGVSTSVIIDPIQTESGPNIGPTRGNGFTVTTLVATAVPQAEVTVYFIVSIPPETPPTTPELLTVAIDVNTLLQTPPVDVSDSVIVAP